MDGRLIAIIMGCLLARVPSAYGESPELRRSWQSDAALYDVSCVSTRVAWAVGEHGSLWQTNDGGQRWTLSQPGTLATLRSVCLLTDQIGWIAGWQTRGSAELTTPFLVRTRDGGQSWESLEVASLSPLRMVRFFGLDEGIVAGEPTRDNPTGVWGSTDGGKTWQPIAGLPTQGWTAAAVASPESGLLADREGNITLLAGPQLLPSRLPSLKGRTIQGLAISSENRSWLVGDGGLVMTSPSGGVVWESPDGDLPADLRDAADFRTVAVKGTDVWIAGSPGGVIWHSPDEGRRWKKQMTGITTPINQLNFLNGKFGMGVGDLGVILTTHDGGENWTVAQGRGRHAAMLSIHHRASSLSLETVAKISGEQGFRSAAWIATKPTDLPGSLSSADQYQDAISQSGGSAAGLAWTLPLDIPGLELAPEKLQAQWERRTEGRLPQVLLGSLVRQIRTWRPHVLIIDQPAPEDAAGQLIYDAALRAIEQAGDSTRFIIHRELGGLAAWKVDRVYLQLLPGSTGEIAIDPFEFLPRWQASGRLATAKSRALLSQTTASTSRPNFRAIDLTGKPAPQSRGTDLFTGLSLTPGGDVRRELFPIDDRQLEQQIKAAQRHRNMLAQMERTADDPRLANQMLAQLADVTTGMSPEQASVTLAELWGEYRRQGQLELAEGAAQELLRRYPDQPVSADAARWLLTCWTSEEVAWQRMRRQSPRNATAVKQASYQSNHVKLPELRERLNKALGVSRQIETTWPALAQSSDVEFPLAALHRARGSQNQSDAIYRRWSSQTVDTDQIPGSDRDWSGVVRREIWLSQLPAEVPEGIVSCYRTPQKPLLDGVLSDDCWQTANEWTLAHRSPATMPDVPSPLVMLAYDKEFLYVAASVSRLTGQSADEPATSGRTHDADLRRHDRLTFRLDIDRDYQTWYTFHVDQRGWTSESCGDDAGWNPKWFVAAEGDDQHWRVEVAIPWTELTRQRPGEGTAWGLSLERTAPAVGRQAWIGTGADRQTGASFGMLRFE